MLFASATFLYAFLPAFLVLYYLTPLRARSFTVSFASYVFYGWWRPDFLVLMLLSTVVDFTAAGRIARARAGGAGGRNWLLLSCTVNLGLLGYFKYANFGVETLNALLVARGWEPLEWARVVLPVGISFYTFQTLSYTVDVYRGVSKPVDRFRDMLCFVSMFPQLVAGPIVRYNTIAEQLRRRTHTLDKFSRGVLAFQAGFAKKVLIADALGPIADRCFEAGFLTAADAWIGVCAYSFQLYFDFSGYSDMAIGLGLMIGFRLPVNFDQPYRSTSITEVWRRWHISLSTFLRDYLYLPLGGNRRGPWRTHVNLFITMLLGGLWHGAAWTFVVWGAYNGILLAIERARGKRPLYAGAPYLVRMALTWILWLFGLVLFRSPDLGAAGSYLASMFGSAPEAVTGIAQLIRPVQMLAFVAAVIIVWGFPTTQTLVARARPRFSLSLQPLFLLALIHLHYQEHVPFLYFQF